MRAIFTKVAAVSMIAGGALLVSACNKTETTTTEVNNTVTEEVTVENGVSDTMTGADAATGNVVENTTTTSVVENTTTNVAH